MSDLQPVPTATSASCSRSTPTRATVVAGALLFAIFLVMAWGALHDSAHADSAPSRPRPALPSVVAPALAPAVAVRPARSAPQVKPRPPSPASASVTSGSTSTHPAPSATTRLTSTAKRPLGTATRAWSAGPGRRPAASASSTAPPAVAASTIGSAPPALVLPRPPSRAALPATPKVRKAGSAVVAPPLVNQCNGSDNAGGQAVSCTVAITNDLNLGTGITSSTVTVNECHGAANAPLTCVATTTVSSQVVQAVTQCNESGSGGGGTVACSVAIVNNIVGGTTTSPATVNQCNGSGQGGGVGTLICSPTGATTNATVTQCNGSGNGGGGPGRVQCTVTPSTTQTSALPVTVNQCNGSGNGGGATVTCTVSVTNNFLVAVDIPPGFSPGAAGGPGPAALPLPPASPTARPPNVAAPGRAPPGRITAAALRSGTATAFLTPSGVPSASLARTGADSRRMGLIGFLALMVGALLLGLSRRPTRTRTTVATSWRGGAPPAT